MGKLDKKIGRRDFLKGAGAAAAGAAALGVFGGAAFAAEEPDAVTSASTGAPEQVDPGMVAGGTKYTTFANPDEIGILHTPDITETADAVFVGTGIGGMMGAMILAEQAPEAKIVLLEKNADCGGSTNLAECNTPVSGAKSRLAAYQSGATQAANSNFIKDPMLLAELSIDRGKNSAWLFTKHGIKTEGMFYEGGNGRIPIQKLKAEIESDPAYANLDLRCNARAFDQVNTLIQRHWQGHNTLVGFAMDHGCHEIDGNCGSHGLDMEEDLNILHLYQGYKRKEK